MNMGKRKTILKTVSDLFPGADPRISLLNLYQKHGTIYDVAKIVGVSPSGVYRVIQKIELEELANGNGNGGAPK